MSGKPKSLRERENREILADLGWCKRGAKLYNSEFDKYADSWVQAANIDATRLRELRKTRHSRGN